MEHVIFKGTAKRNAREIAEAIDSVGGQLNAFTAKDCTCLYAKVIDEDLPLAVDVLSDLTMNALLDEEEFQREKGVILEEIAMDEDSTEDVASDLLSEALYGDAPLGHTILGRAEKITAYTREDLVRYRSKHYCPSTTVVALAGNYDPDAIVPLMEKYFGAWENPDVVPLPEVGKLRQGVIRYKEKDTEQLHLYLGYPGAAMGTREKYTQAVLSNLLGGAMYSRLFQKIREEMGMAYSIYSYSSAMLGTGHFGIYAGVAPTNGRVVLEEIERQIKLLLEEGISDQEFIMSKQQLRGGYLLGLESPASRMNALGLNTLYLGAAPTPEETVRQLESVTKEEVEAYARKILTVPPCVVAAGKGAEALLKGEETAHE